jgi:hypothetical protein
MGMSRRWRMIRVGLRMPRVEIGAVESAGDIPRRSTDRAGAIALRRWQNCGMIVRGHADGVDDNTPGPISRSISGIGRYRIPHGVSPPVAGGIRTLPIVVSLSRDGLACSAGGLRLVLALQEHHPQRRDDHQ